MTRRVRAALITVVVLLGLAVAADRISLVVAEGIAGRTIEHSQDLSSAPSVDVHGFPFLTQLISGDYGSVDVTAKDVPVTGAGRTLTVQQVAVHLSGVHVSHGFSVIEAGHATAVATLSYAALSQTLGATVSYAGSGRVQASAGTTIAGVALRGTVSARPELTGNGELSFADAQVSALGVDLPSQLNSLLSGIFATPIPLASLPFGLSFTGLSASSGGVQVTLTGSHVVYDGSSS